MNDNFFKLPQERREVILNSGYKQFSMNTYKKTSMSMVANEAGISKSLLFHYFRNKKEYYLYLYQTAIEKINQQCNINFTNEKVDMFVYLEEYIEKKCKAMCNNRHVFLFLNRAYCETSEEIMDDLVIVGEKCHMVSINEIFNNADRSRLRNESEFENLKRIILYMAEGFTSRNQELMLNSPDLAVRKFQALLDSIKRNYLEV